MSMDWFFVGLVVYLVAVWAAFQWALHRGVIGPISERWDYPVRLMVGTIAMIAYSLTYAVVCTQMIG